MFKKISAGTLVVSGLAVVISSLFDSGTCVAKPALAAYQGGTTVYCAKAVLDPSALDCNECASNGNGGSVKCDSTGLNQTWQYVSGQSPATRFGR